MTSSSEKNIINGAIEEGRISTSSIGVPPREHYYDSMDGTRESKNQNNRKPNAKNEERVALVLFLSQRHKNGRLIKGAIEEAEKIFPFKRASIQLIWKKARPGVLDPSIVVDISNQKKGKSGRKAKYSEGDLATMGDVPLRQRTTLRSLSFAMSIPRTSLWRLLKTGKIVRHSNTVKPLLSDQNKVARVEFCRSFVETSMHFNHMLNYVHIDEKWFYMTKIKDTYYLLPDEDPPERHCKSKRFITKVMFMAAVARPRYDHHRKHRFDGKIGIWPFTYQESAKRNSKNRPKGTLETKAVTCVTKDVVREMIIDKVLPAVRSKWPLRGRGDSVIIQQDNAKPHCTVDDELLVQEMRRDGWDISFRCQPPNSPDMNVLDLGYFNSIQSLQHKKVPRSIDDLVAAVIESFNELQTDTLDDVFLSLQLAMQETMRCGGGNNYKLQHMGKKKLRQQGLLPSTLLCDPAVLLPRST